MADLQTNDVLLALQILAQAEDEIANFDGMARDLAFVASLGPLDADRNFVAENVLISGNQNGGYATLAKAFDASLLQVYGLDSPNLDKALRFLNRLFNQGVSQEAVATMRLRTLAEASSAAKSVGFDGAKAALEASRDVLGVTDASSDDSYGKLLYALSVVPNLRHCPSDLDSEVADFKPADFRPEIVAGNTLDVWTGHMYDSRGNRMLGPELGPNIKKPLPIGGAIKRIADMAICASDMGLSFSDVVGLIGDVRESVLNKEKIQMLSDYSEVEVGFATAVADICYGLLNFGVSRNTISGVLIGAILAWSLVLTEELVDEENPEDVRGYKMGLIAMILAGQGNRLVDSIATTVIRVRDSHLYFARNLLMNVAKGGTDYLLLMKKFLTNAEYDAALRSILEYIGVSIQSLLSMPGIDGLDLRPLGQSVVMPGVGDVEQAASIGLPI